MYDKLIDMLNIFGYQPVFMADTGVEPVEVFNFTNDRRLIRRGPLSDYHPDAQLATDSGARADFVHVETSSKNMSGAVRFLRAALQAIGVQGELALNLGFAGRSDLRFSFENVTYKRVNPSSIDRVIESVDFAGVPEGYLAAGRLHLVYEYLYSGKLLMRKADHSEFDAGSQAAVEGIGGANLTVSFDQERKTEVVFEGPWPAAFAYKAGQLLKSSEGRWYFYPEEVVFRAIEPDRRVAAAAAFPSASVPYSEEVERVLPYMARGFERRPFLPSERTVLSVVTEP